MAELVIFILGIAIGYLIRFIQNKFSNNYGDPVSGSGGSNKPNSNINVK